MEVYLIVLATKFDAETLEGIYASEAAAQQEAMILNAEHGFSNELDGYYYKVKPAKVKDCAISLDRLIEDAKDVVKAWDADTAANEASDGLMERRVRELEEALLGIRR